MAPCVRPGAPMAISKHKAASSGLSDWHRPCVSGSACLHGAARPWMGGSTPLRLGVVASATEEQHSVRRRRRRGQNNSLQQQPVPAGGCSLAPEVERQEGQQSHTAGDLPVSRPQQVRRSVSDVECVWRVALQAARGLPLSGGRGGAASLACWITGQRSRHWHKSEGMGARA